MKSKLKFSLPIFLSLFFFSALSLSAGAASINLNCASLDGHTYQRNDLVHVFITTGNGFRLFDDYLIVIGTTASMINQHVIGVSDDNTDFQPEGSFPANLPCGDYYVRISGRLTADGQVYSNVCGPIHYQGCDGTITTGTITSPICGQATNIPFSTAGYIPAGTTFQVQTTDSPVTGSSVWTAVGGTSSGSPITGVVLPVAYPTARYYRVVSTNTSPIIYGTAIAYTTIPPAGSSFSNPIIAGTVACNVSYIDTKSNTDCYALNTYDGNNQTQIEGQPSNDIWYKFTLSTTSNITVALCQSALYDTYVHVLSASGGHIASNDDEHQVYCTTADNGLRSYLTLNQLAAGNYYVVVEGFSTYTGSITTAITRICGSAPPNTSSVATDNDSEKFGLPIYPNPSTGIIDISYNLSTSDKGAFNIFDINGKVVAQGILDSSVGKNTVNLAGLSNGVYYCNFIVNDQQVKTEKLVIIK